MKDGLGVDVLTAARQRISYVFDHFDNIYASFSGGKDSSVMTHLVMDEAIRRGIKVGLLFIDMEAQYKHTIDHIRAVYDLYQDHIVPYWVSLPIVLSNSVSVYQPRWICWEPEKHDIWTREPDDRYSITDQSYFPFYRYPMEFEEFAPEFGEWYSGNGKNRTACFVGIRSDESLHRYRTVTNENKGKYKDKKWTTKVSDNLYNAYPIYDFQTEDIWRYNGKYNKPYNRIYDLMHQAGLSIHQQRLCQPYGYDQRKGLWLFHILESESWSKIVARVNGANSGAEFVQYSGNVSGQIKITKPEGHTWKSFAILLLKSMPKDLADHYDDKIHTFLNWWSQRGGYYDRDGNFFGFYGMNIPDEVDPKLEADRKAPSWRRVCKSLLRNDYWCKGLSFTQTSSHAYKKYRRYMADRKKLRGYVQLWKR